MKACHYNCVSKTMARKLVIQGKEELKAKLIELFINEPLFNNWETVLITKIIKECDG